MFGHQDEDQHKIDNATPSEPLPDDVLGDDNAGVNDDITRPEPPNHSPTAVPANDNVPVTPAVPVPTIPVDDSPTPVSQNDLLDIKQQALTQLSPLVDHLDQTAEEKFRTTMMMIQASDNQHLIKDAYETAKNISDEKARAQALLDIVNEINYFTQHKDS